MLPSQSSTRSSVRAHMPHPGALWFVVLLWVLAPSIGSQTTVRYGDPARVGNITQPNQTHRFFLLGAQAGDVLRVTFASVRDSYGRLLHALGVSLGTQPIGNGISGAGVLTVKLPTTGTYTITVRAQNATSTGWYAFRLDRLNGPVSAQRTALGWNMSGRISEAADFAIFVVRGEKGAQARLTFSSERDPYGSPLHYAEVLDAQGKRLAIVSGLGTSSPFPFPSDAMYAFFVAAKNYASKGWYAASVGCASYPAKPCDTVPHASSYGKGWRGTNGVPSLTALTPPRVGRTFQLDVGNSSGRSTNAILLMGVDAASLKPAGFGGTVLVSPSTHLMLSLAAAGGRWSLRIPSSPLLYGTGFGMQSLVQDPGAKPAGWAFSRGLLLITGR